MNNAPFLLSSVPDYCHQPRRSQLLSSHAADTTSLLSSVVLVVTMVFCAAFFIMTLGFLLSNEHDSGEHSINRNSLHITYRLNSTVIYPPSDGTHALVWAVKQSTRGCATSCWCFYSGSQRDNKLVSVGLSSRCVQQLIAFTRTNVFYRR